MNPEIAFWKAVVSLFLIAILLAVVGVIQLVQYVLGG